MDIEVIASAKGFYGNRIVAEGERFTVPHGTEASWFAPVHAAPVKASPLKSRGKAVDGVSDLV